MNARELTFALGGGWHGAYGMARCPAHEDRTPSLAIRDGADKILLRCHAGCDQGAVVDALKVRGLWATSSLPRERPTPRPAPRRPAPDDDAIRKREMARQIWAETRPAAGTFTDLYLKRTRGLHWFGIPPSIRHHDALDYKHEGRLLGRWPAMVVEVTDMAGTFLGVQALWLDTTTHPGTVCKADVPTPRKTLYSSGVVWMGRRDVDAIIVAEGVETALSVSQIGWKTLPPWGCCREPDGGPHPLPECPPEPYALTPVACLGAGTLTRFEPPATVRRLFIAEDDDDAGRKATKACAERAAARGITVFVAQVP